MKKLALGLALACAGLFVGTTANAQDNVASAGVELALPMGDFADAANFGYGASVGYELGVSDNFSGLINAGFINYSTEVDGTTIFHIPAQVGGRYYFSEQREGAYGQAKVGIHYQSQGVDQEGVDDQTDVFLSAAPEIGYFVNENISLGVRYQLIFISEDEDIGRESDMGSYLALRAAFNF